MSHERPDPGDLAPPRPGSISRRLLDWLTPSRPLRALGQLRAVRADARLNIYPIDASSLRLLDPERVHYTFQMLRESGFRQSQLDLTGADLAQLSLQPALLLSPLASARWLAVADRALSAATFAFMFQPFTLAVSNECLLSGRVVPMASRSRLDCCTLRVSEVSQRLLLQFQSHDPDLRQDIDQAMFALTNPTTA